MTAHFNRPADWSSFCDKESQVVLLVRCVRAFQRDWAHGLEAGNEMRLGRGGNRSVNASAGAHSASWRDEGVRVEACIW